MVGIPAVTYLDLLCNKPSVVIKLSLLRLSK